VAVQLAAGAVGVPADGDEGVGAGGRLHAGVAEVGVAGEAVLEGGGGCGGGGCVVLGHEGAGCHGVHGCELGRVGEAVGARGRRRCAGGAGGRGDEVHRRGLVAAEAEVLGGENGHLGGTVGRLGGLEAGTVGRARSRGGHVVEGDPGARRVPRRLAARGRALTALGTHGPAAARGGALIAGAALAAAGRCPRAGIAPRGRVHGGDALLLGTGGLLADDARLVGLEAAVGLCALGGGGGEAGGGRGARVCLGRRGALVSAGRLRGRLGGLAGLVVGREERLVRGRIHAYLTACLDQQRKRTVFSVQLKQKTESEIQYVG
jgi:hypothetical protein